MTRWIRLLRVVSTAGVVLFVAQLFFAIAGDWVPKQVLGHVTYPVYLGLGPWNVDCLGLNISILISALAALILADVLERETGEVDDIWARRQVERPTFIKSV